MRFRGRPRAGRPHILASALAALLVAAGSGTALAETDDLPATPVEPRIQRPGDVAGFRLPFEAGVDIYVHQGWNSIYSHSGRSGFAYDFGIDLGTPILAAASGVVSYVHSGETACGGRELKNSANVVTIDHRDGSSTQYGHLGAISVEVGDVVEVGQEIALSGNSGYTGCMPHLHFARQLQGGVVTQSIPVYFQEFPDVQLVEGQTIRASVGCAGPSRYGAAAEATDDDVVKVAAPPVGRFCATYRGIETRAPALFSRLEKAIGDNWSKRSPGGYWLDDAEQGFAVSWTGQFEIEAAGVYSLEVRSSDLVRVRVDGETLIDAMSDATGRRNVSVAWRATAGTHSIEVEHVDRTGSGSLKVGWSPLVIDGAWVRWSKSKPEA